MFLAMYSNGMKEIFLNFSGYECPKQGGPAEVSIDEVGFAEISPAEVGSAEMGFTEVGPTEISSAEIGIDEFGFAVNPNIQREESA
jgi:hypothetical protein